MKFRRTYPHNRWGRMFRPSPEHSNFLNTLFLFLYCIYPLFILSFLFIIYLVILSHAQYTYHTRRCSTMLIFVFVIVTCFSYFCLFCCFAIIVNSLVSVQLNTPGLQVNFFGNIANNCILLNLECSESE